MPAVSGIERTPALASLVALDRVNQSIRILLEGAYQSRATDIHLSRQGSQGLVRERVDGRVRHLTHELSLRDLTLLTGRLKVLCDLNAASGQRPQEGCFRIDLDSRSPIEVRASFMPTLEGESIALRLMGTQRGVLRLEELGMDQTVLDRIRQLVDRTEGLLLSVGPTGSGKTTTLHALAQDMGGSSRRILSIEDPIEQRLIDVLQVQINPQEGFDYPGALMSALRHDPSYLRAAVAAGEASGQPGPILENLSSMLRARFDIRSKMALRLAHPIAVLSVLTVITSFATIFLLPKFVAIVTRSGQELPAITRLVWSALNFQYEIRVLAAVGLATILGLAYLILRRGFFR